MPAETCLLVNGKSLLWPELFFARASFSSSTRQHPLSVGLHRALSDPNANHCTDYETDAVIQSSLRNELKSDVTVITVAHRLQTIMDSDKIVSPFLNLVFLWSCSLLHRWCSMRATWWNLMRPKCCWPRRRVCCGLLWMRVQTRTRYTPWQRKGPEITHASGRSGRHAMSIGLCTRHHGM